MIATIREWEETHELNDPELDYYQRWLSALEKIAIASGVIEANELEIQLKQLLACKAGS